MRNRLRILTVFTFFGISHAHAALKFDCVALLKHLQSGDSEVVDVPEIFSPHQTPSPKQAVETLGVLLRLDTIMTSMDKFHSSLPHGKPTPEELERAIQSYTDEFALLPTSDPTERRRIGETNSGVERLLARANLPPAVRQRIVDYRYALERTGLEPGLPFSQVIKDCLVVYGP